MHGSRVPTLAAFSLCLKPVKDIKNLWRQTDLMKI
ncbi:MAG: hypothetical protein LZF86_240125 [Nitrospira sp.]|nr:MAG: hypothetical protein LZF86_240125 [Nitrospira sp.]